MAKLRDGTRTREQRRITHRIIHGHGTFINSVVFYVFYHDLKTGCCFHRTFFYTLLFRLSNKLRFIHKRFLTSSITLNLCFSTVVRCFRCLLPKIWQEVLRTSRPSVHKYCKSKGPLSFSRFRIPITTNTKVPRRLHT